MQTQDSIRCWTIWLATSEKGLLDICVNCNHESSCAVRAGLSYTALYDFTRFFAIADLLKTEKKYIKMESAFSDYHARTAQVELKLHFMQMSEIPFSCVASHMGYGVLL